MYYIDQCLAVIEKYIYEKKGVRVKILPPYGAEQEKKFIQALNIACSHYNLWL